MLGGRFARSTSPSSINNYNNVTREVSPYKVQPQDHHKDHQQQQERQPQQHVEQQYQQQQDVDLHCGESALPVTTAAAAAAARCAGGNGGALVGGLAPPGKTGPVVQTPGEVSAVLCSPQAATASAAATSTAKGVEETPGRVTLFNERRLSSCGMAGNSGIVTAAPVEAVDRYADWQEDGDDGGSSPLSSPSRTNLASHPVAFNVLTG
jgi:hypothetical protein